MNRNRKYNTELKYHCVEVSSSYVYSFGSYHVDKQTNRRRWKHSTLFATLRRWVSMLTTVCSAACDGVITRVQIGGVDSSYEEWSR